MVSWIDLAVLDESRPRAQVPGLAGNGVWARLERQPDVADEAKVMIKQPDVRPISQQQLVAEVKGIYAGLVMVESKCIEVDKAQLKCIEDNAQFNTKRTPSQEQWQALTALHRTLLHEHHDFFLASQHPAGSGALKNLANKYHMPARMWRHGIHSFLEILRRHLPASREYMFTFIYFVYSILSVLYESVPAFKETWIECLGDVGRYRMAVEDEDIRDQEVWTSVSRAWYSKASDTAPTLGRLCHHLAILSRLDPLQQLFYYSKSLCVAVPFQSTRESITGLFNTASSPPSKGPRFQAIDITFIQAQGIIFYDRDYHLFGRLVDDYLGLLDNHIKKTTRGWIEPGYYISISLCCALVEFGEASNLFMKAMTTTDETIEDTQTEAPATTAVTSNTIVPAVPSKRFQNAIGLAVKTHDIVLRRFKDPNILPYLHTTMVFILHMSAYPTAIVHLELSFPWKLLIVILNSLLSQYSAPFDRIESDSFPRPESGAPTTPLEQMPRLPADQPPQPLPEDFAMRGLVWTEDYFPPDWFSSEGMDDEKFEMPSVGEERKERILWIACQLASLQRRLLYDREARCFTVVYDVEMDG